MALVDPSADPGVATYARTRVDTVTSLAVTVADAAAISAVVPGYAVLAYARDPERVAADVAAYRAVLREACSPRAVLRPGFPDTDSAEHLAAKTAAATGPGGADAVDFYHYGPAPFPVLDRIPAALKERC